MKQAGLKVFAPATIANLAVGFDILGLAINGPGDEIILRPGVKKGVHVSYIFGDEGKLPRGMDNTAIYAAHKVAEASGHGDLAVEMEIHKKMAFGSGMGSSAASAVAGAFAMNEYLSRPFSKEELLPFAVEGEQVADGAYHADNVAPSLLGGIILIRDYNPIDYVRLPVPKGLTVLLMHPNIQVLTKDSRDILNDQVKMTDHIKQSGHLASFVAALYKSDFDLLSKSLKDFVVENQRAHLIPKFYELKEYALSNGALGFSISGAGPAMFALCTNNLIAEDISQHAKSLYENEGIVLDSFISAVNQQGAYKY